MSIKMLWVSFLLNDAIGSSQQSSICLRQRTCQWTIRYWSVCDRRVTKAAARLTRVFACRRPHNARGSCHAYQILTEPLRVHRDFVGSALFETSSRRTAHQLRNDQRFIW